MAATVQDCFAAALLDPVAPMPDGLSTAAGHRPVKRFEVYRNNVRAGLSGALASRFPAAVRITGEAFFQAMALDYLLGHPPVSPLLLNYGADFPDFVEKFEPASTIPYLADVMRIDGLRVRAYHAADVVPLEASVLAAIEPEKVGSLKFALHPSLGVLRSPYPALTIWAMNSGERDLAPITDWRGEDILVIRPALELRVLALPPGGAAFLQALANGQCLTEAVETAFADDQSFDPERNLGGVLTNGVIASLIDGD